MFIYALLIARRLRDEMTRAAAEKELADRGMGEGIFLVREKVRSASRAVYALSVVRRGKPRHHLLQKRMNSSWTLDDGKPLFCGMV